MAAVELGAVVNLDAVGLAVEVELAVLVAVRLDASQLAAVGFAVEAVVAVGFVLAVRLARIGVHPDRSQRPAPPPRPAPPGGRRRAGAVDAL